MTSLMKGIRGDKNALKINGMGEVYERSLEPANEGDKLCLGLVIYGLSQ